MKTPVQGQNIDKPKLCLIVAQKLKDKGYNIKHIHILSVIDIIFEELVKNLFIGKEFIIKNFGRFLIKKMPSRSYFNFQTGKVEKSIGNKLLRFKLDKKIRFKLLNYLNVEKTFNKENNEETK